MHWRSFVAYLIIQYFSRGLGGGSSVWNRKLLFEFSTTFMFLVFHQMYIFIVIAYWYGSSVPVVLSLSERKYFRTEPNIDMTTLHHIHVLAVGDGIFSTSNLWSIFRLPVNRLCYYIFSIFYRHS